MQTKPLKKYVTNSCKTWRRGWVGWWIMSCFWMYWLHKSPHPQFPKPTIGLGAHLAQVWFICARVDAAAAECQRPNCCLKEALPVSLPVCSSKHRGAWALGVPAWKFCQTCFCSLTVENSDMFLSWQYGHTDGTVGWERRLAWGLQHAMQPECRRNGSEDTWPCATVLTQRDRRLQQGVCHQGQQGNDMKDTSRITTRQGLVLVLFLNNLIFLHFWS